MNQKGPAERRSDGSSGYTDGSTAEGVSTERDPQADDVDGTTDDRTTDGSDDTEKTDGSDDTEKTDGSDDTEKTDGSDDTEKTGGVDDPGTPEEAGVEPIPTDEVFALLSNGRRRHVLRFLSENGGEIKLRELATTIAAEENDLDPVEVTYTQRKRVYTSLYQSHLPRMEWSGVIEYNRNSGLVTLAPGAEGFEAYLEVVDENEFTWSEFYLGLSGLFAAVTLAFVTGTPPFPSIGPGVLMASLTLVLLVSAIAHLRYTRGRRL